MSLGHPQLICAVPSARARESADFHARLYKQLPLKKRIPENRLYKWFTMENAKQPAAGEFFKGEIRSCKSTMQS